MRARKHGRGDFNCRGVKEKWLFTNSQTRLSVFKCTEYLDGEKTTWLECRAYHEHGFDTIVSVDPSEGWLAFDIANGRR